VRRIWTVVVAYCSILIALNGVAFSQQPSEFESLLASAQQAQARGDFEGAAADYGKAVTLQPEIAELQANLGLMYYQTGKDQQAIGSFLQAIRLKPDLFVPNLFLGLDYVQLKRFREAIPYLKRAAFLKPTDPQAQLALGQAYAAMGKTRLAIDSYSRTVRADSSNADGWFHLGVAYLEQVEANARILLARHKDSGYLHALVADTFAEQRAFIQSAEAYKTTLASKEFPLGTHAAYGFVLLSQNDFSVAERELNAELASNPGSLTAKLGLARLQAEQGAAPEAAKAMADIWKSDAGFLKANAPLFNTGLSHSRLSELQSALENGIANQEIPEAILYLFQGTATTDKMTDLSQLSTVASDGHRSAKTSAGTATRLYASGKYEDCSDLLAARLQLLQAKELRLLESCAYPTARYQTAFDAAQKLALNPATEAEGLYWETRSSQKLAIGALARASAIDSNSPTLHVLLGDVYRQRKYYPDAEQEYRKALAIQPADTGALLGLSLALLADSEIDEALGLARAALKKNPDDPELNAVMGEILSAQHDFSGAEPYLKKALNTKPELVPHVHALLGRVYAEANRTQEAITELKMGLADDKDGRLHFQIARLYLKVGDRDSAKKAFEASERLRREGLTRAAVAMQQGENNSESQ
jgi:tetratricopeptide (TPR) repeat protein